MDKDESGECKYKYFRDDFIFDLPESIKDESQRYFEKKSKSIFNSNDYDELFIVLNDCWNYLNPFLLHHVISCYGGKQLMLEMDQYLTRLEKFMNDTSIDDYLKALPPRNRKPPRGRPPLGLQEFITRHELSRTNTLQHIEEIRADFCHTMQLTRFSLYVATFSFGSVIIVWHVTSKVAEMLTHLKQSEERSFEVLSIEG